MASRIILQISVKTDTKLDERIKAIGAELAARDGGKFVSQGQVIERAIALLERETWPTIAPPKTDGNILL